ncbi:MAG: T9SS type A sorting domain-containing protein [Bacteroidota bacterium]
MKKIALLGFAFITSFSVMGQYRKGNLINSATPGKEQHAAISTALPGMITVNTPATPVAMAKTTATTGRWYNYLDSVVGMNSALPGVVMYSGFTIWHDTTGIFGYTPATGSPSYGYNTWTSVGTSMNPWAGAYNDSVAFPHMLKVTPASAYIIDSVIVVGQYGRNPAKPTVVDTLKLSFVYGDGTGTSNLPIYYFSGTTMSTRYGHDTVRYLQMMHDSLTNIAKSNGTAPAPYVVKVPLTAADTSLTNWFTKVIPVNFSVPAGSIAGMGVSFRTGDPAWPSFSFPYDTVRYADGSFKYSDFMPGYGAVGASATSTSWAEYILNDWNVGYWKRLGFYDAGWGDKYVPTWAWESSAPTAGSPSAIQYPYIIYHVKCATCGLTSAWPVAPNSITTVASSPMSVTAQPNPASNDLALSVTLSRTQKVDITISDITGRTVAATEPGAISTGTVHINTSTFANGVYIYTVTGENGERATGRVVVSH